MAKRMMGKLSHIACSTCIMILTYITVVRMQSIVPVDVSSNVAAVAI